MSMSKNERELARELLKEKFNVDQFSEEVQNWLADRLEKYVYNNYKYHARKISYVEYITQLYLHGKGIKAVKDKYEKLLSDLKRTQEELYKKKRIVREGARAWAALHLPPPASDFLELKDEIGIAKPIWEDVYTGINAKVSYMKKLL